jgi:uncharacterized protein
MATVLITGGTGMIGQALTAALIAKGYEVIILSRKRAKKNGATNISYAQWDLQAQTIDAEAVQKADFIVHLAGANVADGRWTEQRKKEIVDSRVKSGALLVKALREIPNNIKAVVSVSAIGWYGTDPQVPNPHPFIESDKPDASFLGQTAQQWEASVQPISDMGKRLVILRAGIVLSNKGGAFKEFKKSLNFGVASILGSGNQIISWIHIEDMVRLFMYALESHSMQGVYNAVAPNPVSNKKLMVEMAKTRPFFIPVHVPEVALKTALGEMSVEVLKSATVSSQKAEAAGFIFYFPDIVHAVKNLMKSKTEKV